MTIAIDQRVRGPTVIRKNVDLVAPRGSLKEAQTIRLDLQSYRPPGATAWELPPWGHALSLGLFPLFVISDRTLILTGSAFCVSKLGFLLTALHNILDVCKHEGIPVPQFLGPFATPNPSLALKHTGLAVFHQQNMGTQLTGSVWPLETVDAAPPSDLAFAYPKAQSSFPYLHLPLSFDLPRIGSKVTCIGYGLAHGASERLEMELLQSGQLNLSGYSHRLHAVEATVTNIFVQRFAQGYLSGPCFSIDADVPHGMSGGPVLSEAGLVCGVVSAGGASFFGAPSTLVSSLYPVLLHYLRFGVTLGAVRIDSNRSLIELIGSDLIRTDGSEEHLVVNDDGNGPMVCPRIHKDDQTNTFDDFDGYQRGLRATKVTSGYRFRRLPAKPPEGNG